MITLARARELWAYDPETGDLRWKVRIPRRRVSIGDKVGGPHPQGYLCIGWDGKCYLNHRLAWFLMTGRWPKQIDHKDRNKKNNRWANLREATQSQNNANTGLFAHNTSGAKGVSWHKRTGTWRADIKVNRRQISLGHFDSFEAACAARAEGARLHFGEFARLS